MTLHIVDRNSGETVYSQIARVLKEEIEHLYAAGDYLPSESVLAERFSVNRHTLRRAIDELVQSGHVERRHGKGTVIIEPPLDYSIHQNSRFTESLAAKGKRADIKVIRKLVMPARGEVSKQLELEEGVPVLLLETLRMVNGAPMCVISHFLPHQQFEAVEKEFTNGSLHKFIRTKFGIQLQRTESLITAIQARGDDATLLKMSNQMPVLRVKSLNINSETAVPVEYAVTRFRSDRIQLSVTF